MAEKEILAHLALDLVERCSSGYGRTVQCVSLKRLSVIISLATTTTTTTASTDGHLSP